jgi:hypothetical protein
MGLFTNKYKKLVIALEQEKAKNNFSSFTECDQPLLQGIMVLTYLLHRIAPTEEDANYAFMDKATDNLHNGEYAVIEDVVYTDPLKHMRMTRADIATHLTEVLLATTNTLKPPEKPKTKNEKENPAAQSGGADEQEGGGIFSESYKDVIDTLIEHPGTSKSNLRSLDDGEDLSKAESLRGGGEAPIVLTIGEDRDAAKPFAAVFLLFHMCCLAGMGNDADAFYASMNPVYKAFSEKYRIVVDMESKVHIAPGDTRFIEKDIMRDHWEFSKEFILPVAMKWLSGAPTLPGSVSNLDSPLPDGGDMITPTPTGVPPDGGDMITPTPTVVPTVAKGGAVLSKGNFVNLDPAFNIFKK